MLRSNTTTVGPGFAPSTGPSITPTWFAASWDIRVLWRSRAAVCLVKEIERPGWMMYVAVVTRLVLQHAPTEGGVGVIVLVGLQE